MTLLTRASQLFPDFPSSLSQLLNDDYDWNTRRVPNVPAVNILENENAYSLELAIPGLQKEDIDINLDQQHLSISGHKKAESDIKEEHYTRREFSYESFSRAFVLPDSVDADQIEANYQDGLLKVVLPKKDRVNVASKTQIKVN